MGLHRRQRTHIRIKHLGLRHLCGFMGQSVVTGQGILGHPGDKHEPSLQGVLTPSSLVHLDFSGLRELDAGGVLLGPHPDSSTFLHTRWSRASCWQSHTLLCIPRTEPRGETTQPSTASLV